MIEAVGYKPQCGLGVCILVNHLTFVLLQSTHVSVQVAVLPLEVTCNLRKEVFP